ncbi:MAG: UbiA family prenyltransferase [Desulfovibrionales bacterium]|nr:UbiA family prenyltransferase [Desulfovibrionales bacterium]
MTIPAYTLQSGRTLDQLVKQFVVLARVPVSAAVSVVSMLGYLLYRQEMTVALFLLGIASFLLCAGCSAVNQVQEKRTDAFFTRTYLRPLPQGLVSIKEALLAGCLWWLLGILFYAIAGGRAAVVCAFLVILLYNGLYTGLKRRTGYALLVGSIAGAMPSLVGWVVAGGYPFDPFIITNCVIWYLVQIPHSWLRVATYLQEYRSPYCPLPVAYVLFTHKAAILRIWRMGFLCCVSFFALICFWRFHVSIGFSISMVFLLVAGMLLPVTTRRSYMLFEATAVLVTLGAIGIQL